MSVSVEEDIAAFKLEYYVSYPPAADASGILSTSKVGNIHYHTDWRVLFIYYMCF